MKLTNPTILTFAKTAAAPPTAPPAQSGPAAATPAPQSEAEADQASQMTPPGQPMDPNAMPMAPDPVEEENRKLQALADNVTLKLQVYDLYKRLEDMKKGKSKAVEHPLRDIDTGKLVNPTTSGQVSPPPLGSK